MAGICERWTGVLVIPGEVLSWHEELVIPFEKISYLVPLRTGISREPAHRTLRAHHSFLMEGK